MMVRAFILLSMSATAVVGIPKIGLNDSTQENGETQPCRQETFGHVNDDCAPFRE